MKKAIVCQSVHHGNTLKIAEAMVAELDAVVVKPGELREKDIEKGDIVGFGSGIYAGRHHRSIISLVKDLPEGKGKKVFVFSTSGWGKRGYNNSLKKLLSSKGYDVIDSFACKGYDTFGPFKLIGGISKGKPDKKDIQSAKEFARKISPLLS